jgi:hypothetical protein
MKRAATIVVLGAVGVLVALAIADALRPSASSEPGGAAASTPATTAETKPPTLLQTLRSEAVSGFVVYSDRDCRLHSLLLPRMVDNVIREKDGADVFRCRFDVDRGRIVPERPAGAADGLMVRNGEVVDGDRIVLTRTDLERAARRNPTVAGLSKRFPLRVHVTSLGRLSAESVAVGIAATMRGVNRPLYLAAIFSDKDIRSIATSFAGPYRGFFTSADGALVGAGNGTVFTRTGGSFDPPQNLPAGRAVAFSPDDRWIAWINGRSFFLIGAQTGGQPARIIRLPIPARDLVWRPITSGTSVGPPIRR